jgi:hypothetical protein
MKNINRLGNPAHIVVDLTTLCGWTTLWALLRQGYYVSFGDIWRATLPSFCCLAFGHRWIRSEPFSAERVCRRCGEWEDDCPRLP